jgi:hypothetical protein
MRDIAGRPMSDICEIVANNMLQIPEDPSVLWKGPMDRNFIVMFCEIASTTAHPKDKVLMETFQDAAIAAGAINAYCETKNLTQARAAREVKQNSDLARYVHAFYGATTKYIEAIACRAEENWRGAALVNWCLVQLQYPCLAVNPRLRSAAIADVDDFLAVNQCNFDAANFRERFTRELCENRVDDDLDEEIKDKPSYDEESYYDEPEFR